MKTGASIGDTVPRESPAVDPLSRPRVLVVDDDEKNLLAIETVIEDLADVVQAQSGEEALRHLLRQNFAVILLDVFMPGIDGYETANLIRQREQSKRTPIIFLTAVNRDPGDMHHGYAMGAVDYVIKPFEPLALRSKVAVFVDLFAMNAQVKQKAEREQRLLDENLKIEQEKVAALEALRQSEERQAIILQSLPIALFLETLDGDLRRPNFVSGNLHALTGFDAEWLKISPALWADRIHPDDRQRVLAARKAVARTGLLSIEYRWQCADGSYRHFLEQAVRLGDRAANLNEIAGTLLDVTERRQLELQLVHSQKIDAIGKLTGGIAHDFNNLLAAVLGGLTLVERKSALSSEAERVLKMTRHAAEQGTQLISRLLAFSRRQELKPTAIDFDAFKIAVFDLLSHTLGGRITIEWSNDKDVGKAFVDRNQLELALVNLVVNARDAMPDGGAITIVTHNRSLDIAGDTGLVPGDYVVMKVTDTGSGIPADELDRIVEPFYTTKPVGKGTGLGLSMVYGFVKQSSGHLKIDSKVGEGTTVNIWLPRATEEIPFIADPDKTEEEDWDEHDGRPLKNVLVVDDHEQVRLTTAQLLRDRGHYVIEADSAKAALCVVRDATVKIEAIITDFAMPHMSGIELIRQVREVRAAMPAVVMTGYADLDLLDARPTGVRVLRKPFNEADLNRVLRDLR